MIKPCWICTNDVFSSDLDDTFWCKTHFSCGGLIVRTCQNLVQNLTVAGALCASFDLGYKYKANEHAGWSWHPGENL